MLRQPIAEGVARFEARLKSKADYLWLYSVEEDRFRTYEDLKAQRDLADYSGQTNRCVIKLNEQLVQDFQQNVLRNPDAHRIPYEDPESFMPEVFPPKGFEETKKGRSYYKNLDEMEVDGSGPGDGDDGGDESD